MKVKTILILAASVLLYSTGCAAIDVALAIEELRPAAKYGGSTTANTRAAYDALRWNDARAKPAWDQIVAADVTAQSKLEDIKTARRNRMMSVKVKVNLIGLTDADILALAELIQGGGTVPAE